MSVRLKYCRCGELIFGNGKYCEDCQKLGKGKWITRKQRKPPKELTKEDVINGRPQLG